MSGKDSMIDLRRVPKFMTARQIVKLGVFGSQSMAFTARKRGDGPDYVKIRCNIWYPKKSIIQYLDRMNIEYIIEDENEL